jgi:hypothetical protein
MIQVEQHVMSKKLALFLLVPITLLVFVSVPVATADGIPPKDVGVMLAVGCFAHTDKSTYASIRFEEAFVQIYCPPNGEGVYVRTTCVYMRPAGVTRYFAEIKVGSHVFTWGGSYSPGPFPVHQIGVIVSEPPNLAASWGLGDCIEA